MGDKDVYNAWRHFDLRGDSLRFYSDYSGDNSDDAEVEEET